MDLNWIWSVFGVDLVTKSTKNGSNPAKCDPKATPRRPSCTQDPQVDHKRCPKGSKTNPDAPQDAKSVQNWLQNHSKREPKFNKIKRKTRQEFRTIFEMKNWLKIIKIKRILQGRTLKKRCKNCGFSRFFDCLTFFVQKAFCVFDF